MIIPVSVHIPIAMPEVSADVCNGYSIKTFWNKSLCPREGPVSHLSEACSSHELDSITGSKNKTEQMMQNWRRS